MTAYQISVDTLNDRLDVIKKLQKDLGLSGGSIFQNEAGYTCLAFLTSKNKLVEIGCFKSKEGSLRLELQIDGENSTIRKSMFWTISKMFQKGTLGTITDVCANSLVAERLAARTAPTAVSAPTKVAKREFSRPILKATRAAESAVEIAAQDKAISIASVVPSPPDYTDVPF
jgi:hypothetical protein